MAHTQTMEVTTQVASETRYCDGEFRREHLMLLGSKESLAAKYCSFFRDIAEERKEEH